MTLFRDITFYFRYNKDIRKYIIGNNIDVKKNVQGLPSCRTPAPVACPAEITAQGFALFRALSNCLIHEMTITFKDKHLDKNLLLVHTGVKDYLIKKITKDFVKEGLKQYTLLIIPEFSKTGRLHYHVLMYMDSSEYYYAEIKRYLKRRYGRCEGKQIYNLENIILYLSKDIDKNKGNITPYIITT